MLRTKWAALLLSSAALVLLFLAAHVSIYLTPSINLRDTAPKSLHLPEVEGRPAPFFPLFPTPFPAGALTNATDLGAGAAAYAALLARVGALPPTDRRYLVIHPTSGSSGLGNKLHALSSALLIALCTDRVLLLGHGLSGTIPSLFSPRFRPLFVDDEPLVALLKPDSGANRTAADLDIGPRGWPLLRDINGGRNTIAKCMYAAHGVGDCLGSTPPILLEMVSNQPVDALFFTAEGELTGPDMELIAARLGLTPTRSWWRVLATRTLFASMNDKLSAAITETQRAVGWAAAPAHGLRRVGVHTRLFVDVNKADPVNGMKLDPAYWGCVIDAIASASGGGAAQQPPLIIYYATDTMRTRDEAVARLGHLGRVVWSPNVTAFTHTGGGSVEKSIPALTDWWMLGEGDAIVGSFESTFSLTSSYRRGIPHFPCVANHALWRTAPLPSATSTCTPSVTPRLMST